MTKFLSEANIKLKCYICGKLIEKTFCLVTMLEETDRVFIVHEECSKQLEKDINVISVKTTKGNFNATN